MNMKFFLIFIFTAYLAVWSLVAHADTACPEGIGSMKGDAPFLRTSSTDGKRNLIFCGDDPKAISRNHYHASEYEVIANSDEEPILTFGALDETEIEIQKDVIVITRVEKLPMGKNWAWVDVPNLMYQIDLTRENVIVSCKNVFSSPKLSQQAIAPILNEYAHLDAEANDEQTLDVMFVKLMVAALSGDKQAQHDFDEIRNRPGVDGAVAEFYDIVNRIYVSASTGSYPGCEETENFPIAR